MHFIYNTISIVSGRFTAITRTLRCLQYAQARCARPWRLPLDMLPTRYGRWPVEVYVISQA